MSVFLSLLPLFIFGNLHCAGMCGPLVMLLAKHRYRWAYFLGRLVSFSLCGVLASEMGVVLFSFLAHFHLSAILSMMFGLWVLIIGVYFLMRKPLPISGWIGKHTSKISVRLSLLLSKHSFYAVFFFGMCTILLPCGQTVLVFSTLALAATPLEGLINGFLFALLTSPALIAAMHTSHLFCGQRKNYHLWIGVATLFIGTLSLLRGFADLEYIPHCIANPNAPPHYHIVLY